MSAHPAGPRSASLVSGYAPAVSAVDAHSPSVWPINARWAESGVLEIAGVTAPDLVAQHGSPLFVLDEDDVRMRAHGYVAAFSGCDVFYAAKAFLSVEFARWMLCEGLGIDVCTLGELRTALLAGATGAQLLVHGNNKSVEELRAAVAAQVRFIVVDSLDEIARLEVVARDASATVDVLVRVTVGVEAHTHEFIATAHEDQKFGFSLASGAADAAVTAVLASPHLNFTGLHSHIGSQIFDEQGFIVAIHRLIEFCTHVQSKFHVVVANLNIGGGAGIAYLPSDDPISPAALGQRICAIVREECAVRAFPEPHLIVEPGRAIVGPGGITLYTVGTVKPVAIGPKEVRTYVSVDGGMSDNIRTALYNADYTVAHANRVTTADEASQLVRIVGKHCESGDIVVRDAELLADTAPGDLLAVAATGAYCRSMASNYNSMPRPAVVAVRNGISRVLLRRETIDDLLLLDTAVNHD